MKVVEPSIVSLFEPKNGILTITLNRPEHRNALTIPLLESLAQQFETWQETEPNARVIVLTGAGTSFCAGLDLKETASHAEKASASVERALISIARCPIVTIAKIQGPAVAGGAGLALACDFAVMSDNAQLGFPEVRRGLIPALVSVILSRVASGRVLRELGLMGELITAAQANQMGLVSRVVKATDLDLEVHTMAHAVMHASPNAVREMKRWLEELGGEPLEAAFAKARARHDKVRAHPEAREGAAAFFEKRLPNWVKSADNNKGVGVSE